MRRAAVLYAFLAVGTSCTGGTSTDPADLRNGGIFDDARHAACRWPDDVVAAPASPAAPGCGAWDEFNVCELAADGSKVCTDACGPSSYAVGCDQAEPSPAWACQVIPIPTPEGWLYYCCPCR